jgi:hypothetical protein
MIVDGWETAVMQESDNGVTDLEVGHIHIQEFDLFDQEQ